MSTENTEIETEGEPEGEAEPTMLDVVSEAIDAETIDPEGADDDAPTGDEDEPTNDTEGTDGTDEGTGEGEGEGSGDGSEEGAGDSDADAGSKEGEGEGEGEGSESDSTEGTGSGSESDEDAPGGVPATTEKPDFINDPIPEELKEGTKNRIHGLIGQVKENETAADERDEMIDHITSSGATGEQFGATLGWLTLYNSDRIEDRREALKIMNDAVVGLAKEIGEPIAGADILSKHADLQAEVEEGTLKQPRAEEIAAARDRKVATDAAAETGRATATADAGAQAALGRGKAALNQLEVALSASDPQWAQKKALLLPTLKLTMKNVHPDAWGATFRAAYDNVKLPAAVETPKPKPKPKTPEPLRPKTPAGQGTKTPSTMAEAIDFSLGEFEDEG